MSSDEASYAEGSSDDDAHRSRRDRSRSAAIPGSPQRALRNLGKAPARPPPRQSLREGRATSYDFTGPELDLDDDETGEEDAGEGDDEGELQVVELEEEDGVEPEPVELGDDLDPINSGAVTPAIAAPKKRVFPKKKETKVIKGQTYTIVDDEIILDEDPRGEAKIDADGNLLGGRQYKPPTFTSPLRSNPHKVYMLSIDAARSSGYRDSLYFFRRNPLIHKLTCTQSEKDKLIDLGKLSSNLKSRAVTMVSAKNCFKVCGATFVKDGRYVFDDYYEDRAIAAGHTPGEAVHIEPYEPEKDVAPTTASKGGAGGGLGKPGRPPGSHKPKDELISSQIGGGLNATFGGTGLQPFGKTWDPAAKKAKPAAHLTVENWMFEYAKQVTETNRELGITRKSNVGQVQVGLGVEEKEEDMWIEVEADDEDDEEPAHLPQAMEVEPPISATPFDFANLISAPPSTSDFGSTSRADTPSAPPPIKKRKLVKVYNPLRGIYEPETNVPHVYQSTQPTHAMIQQVASSPCIFLQGDEGENDEHRRKWRKLEAAAGRKGVASVQYVVDEDAVYGFNREPLVPGMWDFRAGHFEPGEEL